MVVGNETWNADPCDSCLWEENDIAQGTDGCSHGYLMEGVMVGKEMLSFVDLAKSAIDRCPKLLDWIRE